MSATGEDAPRRRPRGGHLSEIHSGTIVTPAQEALNALEGALRLGALVATAIANAENKSELAPSLKRLVAASDEARRRRIERDLHDGTQQRLVSLALAARPAAAEPSAEWRRAREVLADRDRRRQRNGLGDAA